MLLWLYGDLHARIFLILKIASAAVVAPLLFVVCRPTGQMKAWRSGAIAC